MSTTVRAATTVEAASASAVRPTTAEAASASAVEAASASAARPATTMETAAIKPAVTVKLASALKPTLAAETLSPLEATVMIEIAPPAIIESAIVLIELAPPAVVPVAAPESWAPVEAVEPRTCADEEPAIKPFRPVIAIGRTCVRVIVIVAIVADWSWAHVRRGTDSDANYNSLCMRERSGCQEDAEYCENLQVSHCQIPSESRHLENSESVSAFNSTLWMTQCRSRAKERPGKKNLRSIA